MKRPFSLVRFQGNAGIDCLYCKDHGLKPTVSRDSFIRMAAVADFAALRCLSVRQLVPRVRIVASAREHENPVSGRCR